MILALDSLPDKDAVVVFRRGHAQVILPGTYGYNITCGKTAKVLPMFNALSGHLVISCDNYTAAGETTTSSSTASCTIDHRGVRDEPTLAAN